MQMRYGERHSSRLSDRERDELKRMIRQDCPWQDGADIPRAAEIIESRYIATGDRKLVDDILSGKEFVTFRGGASEPWTLRSKVKI